MVMSGSQRSKEDDVQKISTSVFITNFPDGYGAKDLWNTCKLYGHVVNVFIPDRRTKAGKRFGFVRFLKEPLHKQSNKVNNKGTNNVNHGAKGMTNSYAHMVKGNQVQNVGMEECPNMMLDKTCLNHEDFSLCLLGKVKEFASLTNLKVVLGKEGYANIELKYMGGSWVMIVFQDDETKKRFQFNLAVGSWFSQIIQAHNDFVIDERVIWVEVEGVPCKWWSRNTFSRIASRWGTLLNGEELEKEGYHSNRICIRTKLKTVVFDYFKMVYRGMTYVEGESDREEVLETNFEELPNTSIFEGNSVRQNDVHSKDPFGIYEVLNKKKDGKNIDDKHEDSLKYPPGFTPNEERDVPVEKVDNWSDGNRVNDGQEDGVCVGQHVHERVEVSNDTHESTCSGHFKKSKVSRKGGSIVELIDDLVNVGQTMGYDITGCLAQKAKKDWVKELCVSYKVNFVSLQETKMEKIDLWCIKSEVVIMGDFNEVCDNSERFGSIFNKHGAEAFNSFIVNAGLVEVPLGGCSFTWCHKSAKKMSKLDRFLISDNLMCSCPSNSYRLYKESLNSRKSILKAELANLDGVIDKGEGSNVDGHRRQEVVRLIQEVEKVDAIANSSAVVTQQLNSGNSSALTVAK
nr:nucleotide-binding alpha-beta plait domain-containing protein [Tanacetum cinerariifolium]